MNRHWSVTSSFFRIVRLMLLSNRLKTLAKKRIEMAIQEFGEQTLDATLIKRTVIYSPSSTRLNPISSMRIIFSILSTRGLTRTIIYLFGARIDTNVVNVSRWTRREVVFWALANKSFLQREFLSKVAFKNIVLGQQDLIQEVSKHHFVSEHYRPKIDLTGDVSLETHSDAVSYVKNWRRRIFRQHPFSFHSLLLVDTKLAFDLVRTLRLDASLLKLPSKYYEDLVQVFDEEVSLAIEASPGSSASIDELSGLSLVSSTQIFENVEIWHQRFLIQEAKLIVIDATSNPRLPFVAGQWQFTRKLPNNRALICLRRPSGSESSLEEAIYLMGRVDENWYHFLLDTLPRLLILDQLEKDIPLLIRRDIPNHFKDLVQRLTNRTIIEVDPWSKLRITRLFTLPARSTVFDSRPPRGFSRVRFSPETMLRLRSILLNSLITTEGNGRDMQRIAISRKSSMRNVENWEILTNVLRDFDFQILSDADNWYKDQITLFNHSKIVVSAGGAAMANLLFMEAGQICILLTNPESKRFGLWRELASFSGVDLIEVTGKPQSFSFKKDKKLHVSFYVNPKKLERTLSTLTTSNR
jgi:hypothetical protein